jgi:chemotaxis protein methyltransferase CheR
MSVGAILSDPAYPRLKEFVLHHTGLDYYAAKDEDFATRIARRLPASKSSSCAAYLRLLERAPTNQDEIHALVGELTIGETYFFRQHEHFDFLRSTILPMLLRGKTSKKLRIWSAGCATGAEPYSVAILLYREFAAEIQDWDVYILGTDINPEFLAQARKGDFSEWALRGVAPELRNDCFRKEGKHWSLAEQFRNKVTFRYHNLADDSPPASLDSEPFDLILCRNVMIYFSPERTRAVAAQLFAQLAGGGWLLVGHAEHSSETFAQFELVRGPGVTAYRKPLRPEETEVNTAPVWLPLPDEAAALTLAAPHFDSAPAHARVEDAIPAASAPVADESNLEDCRILADRGEWSAAGNICQKRIEADPLDARAHFLLGLIFAHSGTTGAAIAELRRAIYVDRQFVLAFYHLGTLLQSAGYPGDAAKAFRNVLALLARRNSEDMVECGDGIKAGELRELTHMHQETLAG